MKVFTYAVVINIIDLSTKSCGLYVRLIKVRFKYFSEQVNHLTKDLVVCSTSKFENLSVLNYKCNRDEMPLTFTDLENLSFLLPMFLFIDDKLWMVFSYSLCLLRSLVRLAFVHFVWNCREMPRIFNDK